MSKVPESFSKGHAGGRQCYIICRIGGYLLLDDLLYLLLHTLDLLCYVMAVIINARSVVLNGMSVTLYVTDRYVYNPSKILHLFCITVIICCTVP